MPDLVLKSENLRTAASGFSGAAADVPTSAPLSMGSVSASDVTAAANDFNMWAAYAGLVARTQLLGLADSTTEAAQAMEQLEAQLAAGAVAA